MSEQVSRIVRIIARLPGALLARTGISPNAVTLSGVAANVAVGAAIAAGRLDAAATGLLILAAGFFDALDGAVAKQTGRSSEFGAFLDSVTDRISDSVVLLGLLIVHLDRGARPEVVAIAAALTSFPLVSYARAKAEALGVECKDGAITRPVRVILLGASCWWGGFLPIVAGLAAGSFVTAIHRILIVRRALEAAE